MRNKQQAENKAKNNRHARNSKRMDAKCNALGFLASCDEMSRFTPNLYDNIFIFKPKRKEDAIAEREKFKQAEPVFDELTPVMFEDEFVSVVEPEVEQIEQVVQEEVTPDVALEQPVYVEAVQEPQPIEQPIEQPTKEEYFAAEQIQKEEPVSLPFVQEKPVEEVVIAQPIPVSIPKAATKVYVTELQPTPVVNLEPTPVVNLEPTPVVALEPIPVVTLQPVTIVALEPIAVVEKPVVIEEEPILQAAETVVEEVVDEVVEEPIVEEVIENIPEEAEEIVEEIQPTRPFMAIMIPSSTEEDAELLKERYKTVPFDKRLERSSDAVREYYSVLKNELLSYDRVKSRMSKKFDTFSIGRFTIAKLTVKNDVIKLYLALANDSIDTKYYTEDVSSSEIYDQTPTLHNVKSKRGLKYGLELIKEIMESIGYSKSENYQQVDFGAEFAPVPVSKKKEFIADLMTSSVSVNSCNVITNELAYDMLDIVKSEEYTINKFYPVNKFRIYTDDLVHWFNDGDVVSISTLQEKGALPKMDNLFLEVHGRGLLDRKLFVEAHSYDMKAIKMILLTDGEVIQYK